MQKRTRTILVQRTKQQLMLAALILLASSALSPGRCMASPLQNGTEAVAQQSRHSGQLIAMTNEVRSMCQQAEDLINHRKFDEAIRLLHQAEQMDPTCGEVHGYLGMAYQNSLKTAQAVPEYQKALQLNPAMSFINVNLGTCYLNLNQPQQAAPYFQQYLQDNPNAPDAAQVRQYLQQVGTRQGQASLRGVVEQGQHLLQQQRYREAQAAFEQAVAQQPQFAPAHFYLAYALAQQGQNQRAIQEFQTCLQIDPSTKEAVLNIGSNYQSLGDAGNAIAWYSRYLKENPNSPKSGDIKERISGLQRQMQEQGGAQATQTSGGGAEDDYVANAGSGGHYYRWMRFPVAVFIAGGNNAQLYRDSYAQSLVDAFNAWAAASQGRLAFVRVPAPNQAQIVCDWTDNANMVAQGGRAVEGGLTRLSGQPLQNGDVGITAVTMTILTNRGGTPLSDDDMKKVCLHEVGHAIGINGHSNNNHDVMFFSESPTIWPSLTKRDKATVCRLYASYPSAQINAQ